MLEITETEPMKETNPHLEKFQRFEREATQPTWLFPVRKAGIARFAELGFPTLQDEDWRFTNVKAISKLPFRPAFDRLQTLIAPEVVAQAPFGSLPAFRLVFLNGHFAPELSCLPTGGSVRVKNMAAALVEDSALVEKHLGSRIQAAEPDAFSALNTAFFQDGAFIHIPARERLAKPIHLLFLFTIKESGTTAQPRNLILAEEGSEATILESYSATTDGGYFTNSVTELVIGEGAKVEHVKFQDEGTSAYHVAAIHSHLSRNSNFISHSFATGARLSRNNIRTSLAGEGVECVLNGLYLLNGDQLADHHMVVEHAQPHCNSHEYYNGILDGRSKGVFHGRILVRQIAQKTDAKQTNKNLLLSDEATVDTKPQLEIYADDVKCTHGATIGQLNDESIFYLRARGIGAATARRMLIHAFAGEIVDRIRHEGAREEMNQVIWNRLEANPHLTERG